MADPTTVTTTHDPPPDGPETLRIVSGMIRRYRDRLRSFDQPRHAMTEAAIVALDDILDEIERRMPDARP